ncbi:ABC transporter substrate-binding protein [Methanobrevibacter sp. OttesenSCG-928-K11]|nr:ABC transporter substrate-binding protein [Methanobrevibacter sp. OttesenSCG-928-K11]MDL2270781.1 ABC transporter substrate-binding protein [Methanobrevibacter sp. OttesenSCG-928-I08]
MNKKLIFGIIAIIAVIAIAGAYMFMGSGSDDGVVKIGYLPSDHDSALFVAQADKSYEAKGIKIETVQFNNGGDLMTAMASGEVDVGYVGITPVLSSIEKGVPVKVISGAQIEGSGLVVGNSSNITSVADLKGKSVATPGEASIQYMLLEYALNQSGLSIDDVEASAMKVAPMNDALNSGKIDAMLTYEPFVSTAVNNGAIELESSADILPGHPCCVVVASDDFIKNNPDELKDILEIHENATNYINENPDDAAGKLPKDIVSDIEVEKKSLSNIEFVSGLNDTYKQSIMDFMNLEIKLGLLKEVIPENKIFYSA